MDGASGHHVPGAALPVSHPAHALVGGFSVSSPALTAPTGCPVGSSSSRCPTPPGSPLAALMSPGPHPVSRPSHLPGATALPASLSQLLGRCSHGLPGWPSLAGRFLLSRCFLARARAERGLCTSLQPGPRPALLPAPHTHHERPCGQSCPPPGPGRPALLLPSSAGWANTSHTSAASRLPDTRTAGRMCVRQPRVSGACSVPGQQETV